MVDIAYSSLNTYSNLIKYTSLDNINSIFKIAAIEIILQGSICDNLKSTKLLLDYQKTLSNILIGNFMSITNKARLFNYKLKFENIQNYKNNKNIISFNYLNIPVVHNQHLYLKKIKINKIVTKKIYLKNNLNFNNFLLNFKYKYSDYLHIVNYKINSPKPIGKRSTYLALYFNIFKGQFLDLKSYFPYIENGIFNYKIKKYIIVSNIYNIFKLTISEGFIQNFYYFFIKNS